MSVEENPGVEVLSVSDDCFAEHRVAIQQSVKCFGSSEFIRLSVRQAIRDPNWTVHDG